MKVKRSQLVEGCILADDVWIQSNQPLIRKKTVLQSEELKVLEAFLINEVEIEKKLESGEIVNIPEIIEIDNENSVVDESFVEFYTEAVREYKKFFQHWQAGSPINIKGIQKLLYPLIGKVINDPTNIKLFPQLSKKEEYLAHHSIAVGVIAAYVGYKLNFSKEEWTQIGIAGILADCGMSQIPMSIMKKAGPLTTEEYEVVKKHPVHSYKMVSEIKELPNPVMLAVLQHHEREDGSGYPMAVPANKLHVYSQVVAIADVYNALTSERLYRSKKSSFMALETIAIEEFGGFQHNIVQTLIHNIVTYSVGTKVKISNGKLAEIVFMDQKNLLRPLLKYVDTGEFINLADRLQLQITEVLN
ncbi:HD-GYP domain-containing protein [Bacillus alkalicellulosilyticus]|uniref:HD-GYP domain-containing protein n=1 Tax=Alkalihalobacterium alkalicellulosilyticum TaxID=1912214 RepID=UPI000997ED14|nr:HD domain-containing phosphohydrolase [Bacillus alkalicellulosilyticus]